MQTSPEHVVRALRMLRRHKRFVALAVLSLGIAIALTTTMYSVLDAMISPKLLIFEHERLYEAPYFGDYRRRVPVPERNRAIQEVLTFHAGVAGFVQELGSNTIERGNIIRSARTRTITANYFAVLGVQPSAGRLLSQADLSSTPTTVVLSERIWKQLFPERDRFATATVHLNGESRTVVGLLRYEADYPGAYTDVWQVSPAAALAHIPLDLFRLKGGVTPIQAEAELQTLNLRIMERSGDQLPHAGFRFRQWIKPQFRAWGFHLALIGAVLSVLLIACANLANLQLARGVARTKELATRAAIGASRGAIIRQLVGETAWLALGGLVVGGILTAWGMKLIETSVPDTLAEYVTRPQASWRVMLSAVLATSFCLLTVGLLPAVKLSRVDIDSLLKSGTGTGQSRKARRQYAYLVVVEIALALSLLSGATLLMRAALSLHGGFPSQYRQLASAFVTVRPVAGDLRTRRAWSDYLIQQAHREPEIVSAATSSSRWPSRRAVSVDDPSGIPRVFEALSMAWGYRVVSPDFLRTMQLPILQGRDFAPGEFSEAHVIVDQNTARLLWPGGNPIGRLVKLDSPQTRAPWLRVIGVAESPLQHWEIRDRALRSRDPRPVLGNIWVVNAQDTALVVPFRLYPIQGGMNLNLFVRGLGDPRRVPTLLRRAMSAAGPGIAVINPASYEDHVGIRVLREKHDFIAALFSVFALCALALAALGVYAIIAHSVAQRAREFGVRIAVGASAADIRQLVLRDGNVLSLTGIAVGLLITARSADLLRAFLFSESDRHDSALFATVAAALFGVAWLASYIPARRATRINPIEALRND